MPEPIKYLRLKVYFSYISIILANSIVTLLISEFKYGRFR